MEYFNPKDFSTHLSLLKEIYQDLFSGGKAFRGKLTELMSQGVGLESAKSRKLAENIEYLHHCSLLHDDFIDQSPVRREKEAAWSKYSPKYAVLSGDYLSSKSIYNLCSFDEIELVKLTLELLCSLVEGEWIQDSYRNKNNLRLEHMNQVTDLKTGSIFKWIFKAPFLLKDPSKDSLMNHLDSLGILFGRILQRSDDLLDFDIRNYENKSILIDVRAGFLNSFSAFLLEDEKKDVKDSFFKIKNMEDLYQLMSKDQISKKLKDFDSLNESMINEVNLKLDQIKGEFTDLDKLESIKKLISIIYWRKK